MTPWEILWTRPALHDLRHLDRTVAARVLQALDIYAETGHGDVTRLAGSGEKHRLRIGDWRVIFRFDRAAHAIVVLSVEPRGDAYRR